MRYDFQTEGPLHICVCSFVVHTLNVSSIVRLNVSIDACKSPTNKNRLTEEWAP